MRREGKGWRVQIFHLCNLVNCGRATTAERGYCDLKVTYHTATHTHTPSGGMLRHREVASHKLQDVGLSCEVSSEETVHMLASPTSLILIYTSNTSHLNPTSKQYTIRRQIHFVAY